MITDEMLIATLFMMIMLIINVIGYTKIPAVSFVGILGTMILTPQTLIDFGDYWMFGLILVLLNMVIPTVRLTSTLRSKK
jgi:hypothetical protein